MNTETKNTIQDIKFDEFYKRLLDNHKPLKSAPTKKTCKNIGSIVVNFQLLEYNLIRLIEVLTGLHQKTNDIITAKHSFKSLVEIIKLLIIDKGQYSEELELLFNKCFKAEEIRNQIIHSLWVTGGRMKTKAHHKKGIIYGHENYSNSEEEEISKWLIKLNTATFWLRIDIANNKPYP